MVKSKKKRDRESGSSASSIGDLDTSKSEERILKQKRRKVRKDENRSHNKDSVITEEENDTDDEESRKEKKENKGSLTVSLASIQRELRMINERLNEVAVTNDDNMKEMVTEIVKKVKEEMLKLVDRIFKVKKENDELKKELERCRKKVKESTEASKQNVCDTEHRLMVQKRQLNDLEQYIGEGIT